jgi:Secretion system C-terminal sorting domain/Beta-propeller repeat
MKNKTLFILVLISQLGFGQFNYQRDWATYYGGESTIVNDVAKDSIGNVYIVGSVEGSAPYSNSFVTANAHQNYYGGGVSDGFIAKYDTNGLLVWATFYGGLYQDIVTSITFDSQDNVYIVGGTKSSNNISTIGSHQPNKYDPNSEEFDAFLAKFSVRGVLEWATYYGGNQRDGAISVTCDLADNIYILGSTESTTNIATTGSFQPNMIGAYNGMIVKFDSNGNRIFGTYYGTVSIVTDMIFDRANNFYVTGRTTDNTGYFATPGCYQSQNLVYETAFISKFSATGNRLYSTYFGTHGITIGTSVRTDSLRNLYLSGYVSELAVSNMATAGSYQSQYGGGGSDLFIAKFQENGDLVYSTYYGGLNEDGDVNNFRSSRLTIDTEDNVYLNGITNSSNGIASPGAFKEEISGNQTYDCFIAKFNPSGNRLWGTYYGGDDDELNTSSFIFNTDFYLCGTTKSTNNISTSGSFQPNKIGSDIASNAFVAKFSLSPLTTPKNELEKLKLFPNPNKGSFTIKGNIAGLQNLEMVIYDNQGRTIYNKKLTAFEDNTSVYLENKLQSGIYFVKIFNSEIKKTIKMIIE